MDNSKTSSSSANGPQEPSNHDELLMQQSLLFSDTLKDLKNLRKQLYSAADYFELAYYKEDQKQVVVETLKGYAIKALVSTVDHLGSVAYKVNKFLDQEIGEVSAMELRFFCTEQRLEACQEFINQGGLSQQSLAIKTPKHHKRYIFPVDEENMDAHSHTKSNYHSRSFSTEHNLLDLKNAVQATIKGDPSSLRERHSKSQYSPQFYSRQGAFTITRTSTNNKPERRSSSPQHSPLIRSGSLLKRPVSSNYTNTRRRYPSEPRRSVSLSMYSERDKTKDSDQQYSGKSKRLFKALLRLR
ncbi:protein ABIL2-like [Populus alba x Populus x berolinensis]|nr:protein ABIL2-like [Populus alba x Populus x berolinensis]